MLSILALDRVRIDDPVGAISVHGTAGIWGILAVLLSNEDATLGGQLAGIGVIFAFVFASSFIVWLTLKATIGIRVSKNDEMEGVDLAECGMQAYPEFVAGQFSGSDSPTAGRKKRDSLAPAVLTPSNSTAT